VKIIAFQGLWKWGEGPRETIMCPNFVIIIKQTMSVQTEEDGILYMLQAICVIGIL
jgi:hypothetical protein